jgi:hypothetical protein
MRGVCGGGEGTRGSAPYAAGVGAARWEVPCWRLTGEGCGVSVRREPAKARLGARAGRFSEGVSALCASEDREGAVETLALRRDTLGATHQLDVSWASIRSIEDWSAT